MSILVGHSDDPDGGRAVLDVVEQLRPQLRGRPPAGGLLYTCIDIDHQAILDGIQHAFPGMPLIGCTTDGECSNVLDFTEDSVVLTLFAGDGLDVRVGVGHGVRANVDRAVEDAMRQVRVGGDPSLVVALPESIGVSGASIVSALNRHVPPGTTLVGGTAGDQWQFANTFQFHGNRVLSDCVPLLALGGGLQVSVGIASGWTPLGRRGVVTRAEGALLYEVDGMSAMDFLRQNMGAHADPNPEFPFAVFDDSGDDFYLRAPMGAGDDGHIVFAGDVPVGAEVQVTEAGRDQILDGARRAVEDAVAGFDGEPDGLLVFSCAARKQVLGTRCAEEIGLLRTPLPSHVCSAGFYTYGEIGPLHAGAPARFHNETVVAALIGL